jgi:hypothetical protein
VKLKKSTNEIENLATMLISHVSFGNYKYIVVRLNILPANEFMANCGNRMRICGVIFSPCRKWKKIRKYFINLRKRCSVEVVQFYTNHTFLNHSNTAHCRSPDATSTIQALS